MLHEIFEYLALLPKMIHAFSIEIDENFSPHSYASYYSTKLHASCSCDKNQRLNLLASDDGDLWSDNEVVMIEE
jgi:hypothetical protein